MASAVQAAFELPSLATAETISFMKYKFFATQINDEIQKSKFTWKGDDGRRDGY